MLLLSLTSRDTRHKIRWNMKLHRPLKPNLGLIDHDHHNLKPPENDSNYAWEPMEYNAKKRTSYLR